MDDLHSFLSMVCGHCGRTISVPVSCGNRFCQVCNGPRKRKIRGKLSGFINTRKLRPRDTFKMLTLSVASTEDLKAQIDLLVASFRRLRQRAFWRNRVRGGLSVIEVTHSDAGWHAHIHAIIESAFLPYNELLSGWIAASGGRGCHVKAIPPQAITAYVTKYVTKSDMPEALQLQASDALKGRRLFQPFGEWHAPIAAIRIPHAVCRSCGTGYFLYGDAMAYAARTFGARPEPVHDPPHALMPDVANRYVH